MTWLLQWVHSGMHPFDLDGIVGILLSLPGNVLHLRRRR